MLFLIIYLAGIVIFIPTAYRFLFKYMCNGRADNTDRAFMIFIAFFGSTIWPAWIVVAVIAAGCYYAYQTEPVQRLFDFLEG